MYDKKFTFRIRNCVIHSADIKCVSTILSALEVCLFKDMEKFYLQIFYDAKEAIRHANNNSYFIK